ncbi:TPM domain-containing protein [Ilyomonas limi]|uniref:TPM domain-containing protein n=1 Tax=Ilyomonas limi TaxID=2575867 RepID=A0A4U3L748_9BACT|nr:TPM domain-containing protein [Ilyomonas limi]TKK70870.1 TPM domain-containing protein [Ilyomonas limi]
MLFPWQKPKTFFTEEQKQRIVQAVQQAERQTSGEVRVYVESKCRFVDALDRAAEIFFQLQMDKTTLHNGVLVYVAVDDKQVAVYADEGIHAKAGRQYWLGTVAAMLQHFRQEHVAEGICSAVLKIGEALVHHFPYDATTDKNELPDNIVFGK